ncbi:MAG: methionine--tRNA ligase [Omnitrophica WOR_2 bacterium GWF2_43_52]|nr:MAG: methionine--tRNA ligase [Omnitrophica WOR_2 bacterium GWC2_44_8]OGX21384.1 MAG: methionine--tRNA ligase [Omnitrophica WOR_2 bacterium GWF2_43_52]OGX54823.1 MAG: methionine--tRNA ligase [Omnitrophica WOR_2 bacterium RIFOXYC2_FULL_43_9]HAH21990.1 methionine--tRNA ligase [Candidatus Omnitrophota bacterium]HBG62667.1 methionine--tRNA ligase [Candidatus Omnitrophota bacterium]
MKNKFYITTPLYYVNSPPHIGHSYTTVAADTLARFHRNMGDEVYFLTGSDEHGQKIAKAAASAGLSEKAFTDNMVSIFIGLWKSLDISYDDFIRTTDKRHSAAVELVLTILHKNKDIYMDTYEGWYCTPCETFWTDMQVSQDCCPDCRRALERIREDNYFFRLSYYQQWLIEHIQSHPDFIRPVSRYNEVLSFLTTNTLTDLCISRPKSRLKWGIEIPFSTGHVTYVWFDALINYISAVGFGYDEAKFKKYWPADLHLIGKDILRQHAIYWPIILKALGLSLPKMIFAHGWWMVGKDKMSKSRGNVIDPLRLVDAYGVDTYRYFLLRDVPFGLDGTFSNEAIIKRKNSDLANDWGNLTHRTATMVEKYFSGKLPEQGSIKENQLKRDNDNLEAQLRKALEAVDFTAGLDALWLVISEANKFIEDTKPWNLLKENKTEELNSFIMLLVSVIRNVSRALTNFMPQSAKSISEQFASNIIKKGVPLFPRIEVK